MAKLPRAVQIQAERVEELIKARNAPPVAPEVIEDPASIAPETVIPEPKAPTEDERKLDPKYWEHRLKTSQGVFEVEKARLRAENDKRAAQIQELSDTIKEMKQKTVKAINPRDYLSTEDATLIEEDQLRVIAKLAEKKAEESVKQYFDQFIEEKFGPVERRINETQQDIAARKEQLFWGSLDTKVPEWEKVNNSPEFHEWLDDVDVFSGNPRQQLLVSAQQALDADRVVNIFKAFIGTKKSLPTPPKLKSPTPDSIPTGPTPHNDIVPLSRGEIKQFYSDVAKGFYRSRPKEREDMERRVIAATRVGFQ